MWRSKTGIANTKQSRVHQPNQLNGRRRKLHIFEISKTTSDWNDRIGVKVKIKNHNQELIIVSGVQVSIMPYNPRRCKRSDLTTIQGKYRDVSKNGNKFQGKTWVNAQYKEHNILSPRLRKETMKNFTVVNSPEELSVNIKHRSWANRTTNKITEKVR